ncbi:O-methyltransferase [Planococcus sp. 1R117A]|uniref:O-methyltransferase n=1 Tax=Planococcus sp. 1R117A TaxID=3447020 RepID=UPI003EDBB013
MKEEIWNDVDDYFAEKLHNTDPVMEAVHQNNFDAGLPGIDVSPNQGKFLKLMVKLANAKNVLEIGTLGGYSSIWMGRALPDDGRLVTLEYKNAHAIVARENIENAGLSGKIEVIEGAAIDTLPMLKSKGWTHFDLIFIDADKPSYPHYFKWALEYSRPGTVIIADNVVRGGRVLDPEDPNGKAMRDFMDLMSDDTLIDGTVMQTVGSKGYDGFAIGIVK